MSEQLDRIEQLLSQQGAAIATLAASITQLQQGQSEIRADIARVDGRVDELREQLRGESNE